uniref:Uncharacterized protein n=1 Tax=Varanus komodoensis TaxID=61221 RepID=A0A8D2LHU6_VARKO
CKKRARKQEQSQRSERAASREWSTPSQPEPSVPGHWQELLIHADKPGLASHPKVHRLEQHHSNARGGSGVYLFAYIRNQFICCPIGHRPPMKSIMNMSRLQAASGYPWVSQIITSSTTSCMGRGKPELQKRRGGGRTPSARWRSKHASHLQLQ